MTVTAECWVFCVISWTAFLWSFHWYNLLFVCCTCFVYSSNEILLKTNRTWVWISFFKSLLNNICFVPRWTSGISDVERLIKFASIVNWLNFWTKVWVSSFYLKELNLLSACSASWLSLNCKFMKAQNSSILIFGFIFNQGSTLVAVLLFKQLLM